MTLFLTERRLAHASGPADHQFSVIVPDETMIGRDQLWPTAAGGVVMGVFPYTNVNHDPADRAPDLIFLPERRTDDPNFCGRVVREIAPRHLCARHHLTIEGEGADRVFVRVVGEGGVLTIEGSMYSHKGKGSVLRGQTIMLLVPGTARVFLISRQIPSWSGSTWTPEDHPGRSADQATALSSDLGPERERDGVVEVQVAVRAVELINDIFYRPANYERVWLQKPASSQLGFVPSDVYK